MKKILVFLSIVFLASSFLSVTALASAVFQTDSTKTSTAVSPAYSGSGSLIEYDVDYWWIPNVSKDEIVLLSTFQNEIVTYESWLYYSNLTELQNRWGFGTHSHDFVADKTDDYLLKIHALSGGFNYTIKHNARGLPTEITFSVEPNPALVGKNISLLGKLTHESVPIPSEPVKILSNGTFITTLVTNATGWFKASGKVGYAGTFNITVEYAGSIQYLPTSEWQILVVNKANTDIYAKFVPNPVSPGGACELRGILFDQFSNPIKSAEVSLEYSTDYSLSWHPAGTLTTNSYGIFSKTFAAPSSGTYLIRIKYAGSPSHESSTTITALIVI